MRTQDSETTLTRIARQLRNSPVLARLRVRLILLVLFAVLPALGVVIYTAIEQRREGLENARVEVLRLVHTAANSHDQSIESARQLLATLAEMPIIRGRDSNNCYRVFTNLVALHEIYGNMGAFNPDGSAVATAFPLVDVPQAAEHEFFRRAVETGRFAVGEFRVVKSTKKAAVNLGFPVFDEQHRVLIVLFAAIDLDWLYRMHSQANLPPGSSITVLDRNRVTILRFPDPEAKFIGEPLRTPRRPGPRPAERTMIMRGRDGVLRLYASTRLGHMADEPGSIAVGIPVAQAHALANITLRRNLAALGAATLLALAAAWYGGEFFILRRVRRLLATTQRLTHGDLTARTGVGHGDGELHQLARAFDEMAESLQQRVAERERAETNLKGLNEDLERRVAERTLELKRSNEDLEQFAYVASHDLQEPLRMVTNYLQLLQNRYQPQLDTKAQDFIQIAVDGALRMHQLIGDLLTYSRVGTAGKPLAPTNTNDVVKNTLLNLKIAIEEADARVHVEPMPTVKGDPVQLTQVFQNLIANAIKFHSDKPPEIHISARRVTNRVAGPYWEFSVRDNGIGIPSKDYERIFLIFQRLHTREKYPGTGIGLALCKKIIERHGGRIWVESEPDKGTTFYFIIPADN
jgi:signal transduction histidine kinase